MLVDGILFDLDGTLWDSVEGILLTWNQVLSCHPGIRGPISRAEQESLMGLQMDEIARRLFPNLEPEQGMALLEECMDAENEYLYQHGGILYPGVPETLERLHRSFPLYIVSNCQKGYIEAFLHAHRLQQHFDGFLSFGDTGRSKGENIRTVVTGSGLQHPCYVGDTQGDLDSATFAQIPFVYAAYGFGSVDRFDASVSAFSDLCGLFYCG